MNNDVSSFYYYKLNLYAACLARKNKFVRWVLINTLLQTYSLRFIARLATIVCICFPFDFFLSSSLAFRITSVYLRFRTGFRFQCLPFQPIYNLHNRKLLLQSFTFWRRGNYSKAPLITMWLFVLSRQIITHTNELIWSYIRPKEQNLRAPFSLSFRVTV